MPLFLINVIFLAPSGSVEDLKCEVLSSTSLKFTWNLPLQRSVFIFVAQLLYNMDVHVCLSFSRSHLPKWVYRFWREQLTIVKLNILWS